jgi:hypothetical protein
MRKEDLGRVSYHAVTRYCQRVLGAFVDVHPAVNAKQRAYEHCRAAGTTIRAVQRTILTPTVAIGLALGAHYVIAADHVVVIRFGAVVTIGSLDKHRLKQRLQRGDRSGPRPRPLSFQSIAA